MSNLKHLTLSELYKEELDTGRLILWSEKKAISLEKDAKHYRNKANGQLERLKWIRKYIKGHDKSHLFLGAGI